MKEIKVYELVFRRKYVHSKEACKALHCLIYLLQEFGVDIDNKNYRFNKNIVSLELQRNLNYFLKNT